MEELEAALHGFETLLNNLAPSQTAPEARIATRGPAIVESESVIAGKKRFHDSPAKTYTQLELKLQNSDIDYAKEIMTAEEVYKLAQDIFEPENLHTAGNKIYIKFPKLEMTNTNEKKHTIYDMVVRISVTPQTATGSAVKTVIGFTGLRATMTYKEIHSNYRHSHLESGRFGQFTEFCVGSSNFTILKQNTQLVPTTGNWILFLMSIENYLSWESLEGGPFIKISSIHGPDSRTVSSGVIQEEAKRLASIIPDDCIDVGEMKIIEGQAFDEFLDHFARVRKLTTENRFTEEDKTRLKATLLSTGKGLKWSGEEILEFKVLDEEEIPAAPEDNSVNPTLRQNYINGINQLLTTFKTTYNNEWYKQKNPRTHYALGETNSDRQQAVAGSDRLSTQTGRSH